MDILSSQEPVVNLQRNKEIIDLILAKRFNIDKDFDKKYKELTEPSYNLLENIDKLKDVDLASEVIKEGVEYSLSNNKKVVILTDYDCDGINSACVITKIFKYLYTEHSPFITIINKRQYGNGVNFDSLKDINIEDIGLLITADHGSSDESVYKELKAKNKDIKIVVTDHHQIDPKNPPTSIDAFVNPQREDSTFSKNISGCNVAFLVMLKYAILFNKDKTGVNTLNNLLELVGDSLAITTISDVMDVSDPYNRWICHTCFKYISSNLDYVIEFLKHKGPLTYNFLSYKLIPLINSANRTHCEEVGYLALNGDIEALTTLLNSNSTRKSETESLIKTAKCGGDIYGSNGKVVLVRTTLAVTGVIAARIGSECKRPTICFNIGDDSFHGSGRSMVKNFNILAVVKEIENEYPDMFIKVGGHKEALGIEIKKDVNYLDTFIQVFDKKVTEVLKSIEVDDDYIDVDISDINLELVEEISKLEPFGKGFEEPIFRSKITIEDIFIYSSSVDMLARTSYGLIRCKHETNKTNTKNFNKIYVLGNDIYITYNPLQIKRVRGAVTINIKEASLI